MKGHGDTVVGGDVLLETISKLLSSEACLRARARLCFRRERPAHRPFRRRHDETCARGAQREGARRPACERGSGARSCEGSAWRRRRAAGAGRDLHRGGEPYLAHISTTGEDGLLGSNTVVVAAPLADFAGPASRFSRRRWSSRVPAGIGIILSLRVARLISRSLSSLTASARQIGDLELHARASPLPYRRDQYAGGALGRRARRSSTFALYVPRELVRRIVASGQAAAGSAARQEVTVLFTDIRDFTTISERHSPEEVVALLSAYFQLMNDIVERHNGVIVQYLGDSIYAMWNAPSRDPEHVDDGCRCALALKAGVDEFNAATARPDCRNSSPASACIPAMAVVGSFGAQSRRQYTAMGDTVNVASRLEGINKEFGTSILVSGAVRARADRICVPWARQSASEGRAEQSRFSSWSVRRGQRPCRARRGRRCRGATAPAG